MKHLSRPSLLDPLGALDRGRALRLLLPLGLLLLLLPLAMVARPQPDTLATVSLVGPRGPVCIRLVVANDVSGSMQAFAAPRDAALAQFEHWAPQNLRPDDQLGVLEFAGDAAWRTEPAPVGHVGAASSGGAHADGTALAPVLSLLKTLPSSSCDTYLLLLSDGVVSDLPVSETEGRAQLITHGIHGVRLLVPGRHIDVPAPWTAVFPTATPVRFDGNDADATGVAFAQVVSAITGQALKKG